MQTRAHHQELDCINTASGIDTVCEWLSGMQVEQELLDLHYIIYKRNVPQVGHLPEEIVY